MKIITKSEWLEIENMDDRQSTDITLFIYDGMDRFGGIQSIVIRNFRQLQSTEQKAFIVCGELHPAFGVSQDAVIDINQPPAEIAREVVELSDGKRGALHLVALAPPSGPLAYLIQRYVRDLCEHLDPRLSLCILHPRDLMREQEHRHVHILNKLMAFAIGTSNLVFMNEFCRASHERFLGCDLSMCPIVPVPIDPRESSWQPKAGGGTVRIVTVGRIVPFKAYNFVLPKIVADLRSQGFLVECDIYGYGSHEYELVRLIASHGVENFVKFRGPIDLDTFDSTVLPYDLFVGMGTAALQAAQLGLPTLLAIDNDPTGVHGFVYDAPFGNVGEADNTESQTSLSDAIVDFITMTDKERLQVSCRCVSVANQYVFDNYVQKLTENSCIRSGLLGELAAYYSRFYLWMTRDNRFRQLARFAKQLKGSIN
ncbi:glycosyltransferase [Qipengyuania gaetbuli]|uniref:glycosyltransferase n=1 Tax=Qipengyuania gaetbuli TaxID=266952 RepID=UPI001C9A068E|nr:glycosyltransferase [Qipengyuania gaetbuli]MBY6016083.1 glycosyltransferase [Qipengyuania gaetbuli]